MKNTTCKSQDIIIKFRLDYPFVVRGCDSRSYYPYNIVLLEHLTVGKRQSDYFLTDAERFTYKIETDETSEFEIEISAATMMKNTILCNHNIILDGNAYVT